MTIDSEKTVEINDVYVFCKECKENVLVQVSSLDLAKSKGGMTTVVAMHGVPQHAMLVYLDMNLSVRGIEYPTAILQETRVTEATAKDIEKIAETIELDMPILIDAFGMGSKKNIKVLANLFIQIMLSNPVYFIHDDDSIASPIVENIQRLFTEQEISLEVVGRSKINEITERQPFIFDLQKSKYLYEGITVETRRFEKMIKDASSDRNSYFILKNELSKFLFGYEKMKHIIFESKVKLKETQLSKDISIEIALMPILLKMAAAEGIDIKDKVESDGLARALRSI